MNKKIKMRFIQAVLTIILIFMLSFSFTAQSIATEITETTTSKSTTQQTASESTTDKSTLNNDEKCSDEIDNTEESDLDTDPKDEVIYDTSSTATILLKNTANNVDETAKTQETIEEAADSGITNERSSNLLGAPTAMISISGYTEGALWYTNTDTSLYAKPLSITSYFPAVEEGKEYKIRVTLKRQMKFVSYPWNDDWGTVVSDIPGSAYSMPDESSNLLKNNESLFSNNGTPNDITDDTYSLIYTLNNNTTLFNQYGGIRIMPDVSYTYDYDTINEAVKVEILDYNNNVVYNDSINVSVDEHTTNLLNVTSHTAIAGSTNQLMYKVAANVYFKNSSIEFEVYSGTEINKTYPKNPNLSVKSSTGSAVDSSYDSSTGTLTINFSTTIPELYCIKIYGDLTEAGFTSGYNILPKSGSVTAYDGTALAVTTNNKADGLYLLGKTASPSVVQPLSSNVITVNQERINNDINASGYPNRMHDLTFFAVENSTGDEIITYDFTYTGVNISGVYFPLQSGVLKNINITFDDNTTYTINSHASNYISMADIKASSSSRITGNYINTISANCGRFTKGWTGTSQIIGAIRSKTNTIYGSIYSGSNRNTKLCDLSFSGGARRYTGASMDVKAYEYDKSANTFGTAKTTFFGGETVGVKVTFDTSFDGISEPKLYVTVPYAFSLNSNSIKIYQDSTQVSAGNIRINQFPVKHVSGIVSFNCYEIYGIGTVARAYSANGAASKNGLTFELAMDINEAVTFNNFMVYDFFCFRLGSLTEQDVYLYPDDYGNSNFQYDFEQHWVTGYDVYDVDGDLRTSQEETLTRDNRFITTMPYTNLSIHGYVTDDPNTTGPGIYDPGVDGSSDVNVLTMRPDSDVSVVITVINPSTSVGAAKIKAYFPIPKATVSGNTIIPQNADSSFTHYQFYDYKWPMSLAELPQNPDADIFDMVYYTGPLTLGINGEPVDTGNTVANPTSAADIPGGLSNVSMVSVATKDGVNVPGAIIAGVPTIYVFNAKLSIDITCDEVHNTRVNNTKNIIRSMFWRETMQGAGYIDTGYLAIRLSNGGIEGVVFEDSNHNGLRDAEEPTLDNVTVDVYDKADTGFTNPLGTEITGADGVYHIHGLANGSYVARIHNPYPHSDADVYVQGAKRFARKIHYDSSTFINDSDAVADASHDYAIIPFDIPSKGVESEHNMNLGVGFEPPAMVTIKNNDTSKGVITFNGYNVDRDTGVSMFVWSGTTLTEPLLDAEIGYEFMGWTINGEYYDFSTPINSTSEIIGNWRVRLYVNLTYDKYVDADGDGKADSTPTTVTESLNIGSMLTINLDGGTWNETETSIVVFDDRLIFNPIKDGYAFAGWILQNTGNSTYTLTAMWETEDVGNAGGSPVTGDTNLILIALAVCAAALFIITVIIINKKRSGKK